MRTILFIVQYRFCFMCCSFGCKACEILASWPRMELSPSAMEGNVLTTGPPGKAPFLLLQILLIMSTFYWEFTCTKHSAKHMYVISFQL